MYKRILRESYRRSNSLTQLGDFQSKDVVSGDLGATLEAHRASNLARRIRKYEAHPLYLKPSESTNRSDSRRQVAHDQQVTLQPSTSSHRPGNAQEDAYIAARPEHSRLSDDSQNSETAQDTQTSLSKRETLRRQEREKSQLNAALAYGDYVPPLTYRAQTRFTPYLTDTLHESIDGHEKLDRIIRGFEQYIGLTPDEIAARERLLTNIVKQLRSHAVNTDYKPFGSLTTGLATPLSDIDIAFDSHSQPFEVSTTVRAKKKKIKKLQLMHRYMYRMQSIHDPRVVGWARVPVLKMKHAPSGIEIQVVSSLNGLPKIALTQNWMDEFPQLRPIYLIVKTTLDVRGLTDPSTGGLGSYALVCMIVAFLRLGGVSRRDKLSSTLWEFLDFYGHFNTRINGISVEPTSVFKKRGSHHTIQSAELKDIAAEDERLALQQQLALVNENQPWLLCLQDPDDPASDLTKGSTRIMDIRMVFRVLSQRIRSWLAGTRERQTEDPLMPFFGKMLGHVRDRRRHFMRWARTPKINHLTISPPMPEYEISDSDHVEPKSAHDQLSQQA